jgi:two-component system KDP operon response regulator KdpE
MLLVDDDPAMLDAVSVGFEMQWQGCTVVTAADGNAGLARFAEEDPDIVVLDVTMPGRNGFDVLREIRRISDVPVVMLTSHGEEMHQVRGLELGADAYVVKPFSHLALIARVKAVLRRAELPQPTDSMPDFVAGPLEMNFGSHSVSLAGEPVKLTPVEYNLLYYLVRNAGRLMPHQALLDRVWGTEIGATPDYLKVFVSRLRSKIERPGSAKLIENERGIGYRFVKPNDSPSVQRPVATAPD